MTRRTVEGNRPYQILDKRMRDGFVGFEGVVGEVTGGSREFHAG